MTSVSYRKPSAGNSPAWFEETCSAPEKPRRNALHRKIRNAMPIVMAFVSFCSMAYTETVDGVRWTYKITNGEASVGGGASSTPAIPKLATGAIIIPSTLGGKLVTRIGDGAFYNCSGLTSVTIPDRRLSA